MYFLMYIYYLIKCCVLAIKIHYHSARMNNLILMTGRYFEDDTKFRNYARRFYMHADRLNQLKHEFDQLRYEICEKYPFLKED